jgi:hypothetical protein
MVNRRTLGLLAAALVGGCQTLSPRDGSPVVPIYASPADAAAVAAGQFGAVPTAMPAPDDLALLGPQRCKSTVATVRTRDGQDGYLAVTALPHRLKAMLVCTQD